MEIHDKLLDSLFLCFVGLTHTPAAEGHFQE
jgi:hypothetical protein